MAIPAQLALAAAQKASGAVRGDLAVIRYQKQPKKHGKGRKAVVMPGREVEIHVSPAAVGLGILTIGAGLTIGWIWWNGVRIPTLLGSFQVIPGAKDGVKDAYSKGKKKARSYYETQKKKKQ